MKELIGEHVVAVLLSSDKTYLQFFNASLDVISFCTEGDCCNEVWIAHINGLASLIGEKVLCVRENEWKSLDYEDLNMSLEAISWTIRTQKGYFDIEMRNRHTGYGGRLLSLGNKPLGDMILVTEDF